MDGAILWAAVGTGFTFLMTSLGSAMVFFFKSRMNPKVQRIMLGFAAGVMIAAAVWSLLVPAIEEASANGQVGWVPAAGGMALGVAFLMLMDSLLPHLHVDALQSEGLPASFRRTTLLVLAVTLHNIPEGMAVGLSFARAAQHTDGVFNAAALALALGIGLQNFPEGAAISLPLRQEGFSSFRSFVYGSLSAIVEPIFGILVVLIAVFGILLAKTEFGRNVYLVGGNPEAARLAGINVNKIKVQLFMISGAIAALGGVILAARMNSGQPGAAANVDTDAITAVVLGGIAMTGGTGTMFGTFLGLLVLLTLNNGLLVLGVTTYWQNVAKGVVLVFALALDFYRTKRRNKVKETPHN